MNNDLFPMWRKENLGKARAEVKRVGESYNSLKNKNTSYAKGIKRLLDAKKKIVNIWEIS